MADFAKHPPRPGKRGEFVWLVVCPLVFVATMVVLLFSAIHANHDYMNCVERDLVLTTVHVVSLGVVLFASGGAWIAAVIARRSLPGMDWAVVGVVVTVAVSNMLFAGPLSIERACAVGASF